MNTLSNSRYYGSHLFKQRLKASELFYKNTMDANIIIFNHNLRETIITMRTNNPKEFLKLLNKNDKNRDSYKISIDSLFDFFKDLKTNKSDRDAYININIIDVDSNNEMLNDKISAEEITKAVKISKNNKSSADDLIINEYISSCLDCMLDIYVHIFNLIFDTGILPEA
jgi:hypothetical protein